MVMIVSRTTGREAVDWVLLERQRRPLERASSSSRGSRITHSSQFLQLPAQDECRARCRHSICESTGREADTVSRQTERSAQRI